MDQVTPRTTGNSKQHPQRILPDGDAAIVTLEDGDPRLESSTGGSEWDWDAEAVSSAVRCVGCGNAGPLFREPDGRILCEACSGRGPQPTSLAVERQSSVVTP
jgi:hypothetical protein